MALVEDELAKIRIYFPAALLYEYRKQFEVFQFVVKARWGAASMLRNLSGR